MDDDLKMDIDKTFDVAVDDVKPRYNFEKPIQLSEIAHTLANQVYIAPGQERHIVHDLSHVVEQ
ncbi:MAG: hypothetical protein LBD23_10600 [Oscillospiraceae bacterium]|jgi:hypothetical protein|nr:hypothetical protein [Oscillospiraceae bacterium]